MSRVHLNYDCDGKGHGPNASEVPWCHDCSGEDHEGAPVSPPMTRSPLRDALAAEMFRHLAADMKWQAPMESWRALADTILAAPPVREALEATR